MNLATQNGSGPSLAGQAPTPAVAGTAAAPVAPAAPPQGMGLGDFWIFVPLIIGMFLFSALANRKQRRQREKMLSELRKHDRVLTTSGLIGFVSELKPDMVVLKVEEGRDIRLTFTRDAIASVLKPAASEPAANAATE